MYIYLIYYCYCFSCYFVFIVFFSKKQSPGDDDLGIDADVTPISAALANLNASEISHVSRSYIPSPADLYVTNTPPNTCYLMPIEKTVVDLEKIVERLKKDNVKVKITRKLDSMETTNHLY